MPVLSEARIAELVAPYLRPIDGAEAPGLTPSPPEELYERLATYLDLLVRWNGRTNLTAIREPEEMVERHFGESLFAGSLLGRFLRPGDELLDFGSGAGLPGVPIQLLYPQLCVMLAESQGKKAVFLREVVRVLGLRAEVWGERVEQMDTERQFAAVTMRAVDRMAEMTAVARGRVQGGGWLVQFSSATEVKAETECWLMPRTQSSYVWLERVNRG